MNVKNILTKHKSTFVFIIVLFTMRWSLADHYHVPSGSMEPNIHVGDQIGVNKLAYDFKLPFTNISLIKTGEPKRGDIIVFKSPADSGVTMVKRLIAIPGDHVVLQNGEIEINGQKVDTIGSVHESFYYEIWQNKKIKIQRNHLNRRDTDQEFVVPKDMYFFMGDNRDNSLDSRFWGFAPRRNLKGQAKLVLWNMGIQDYLPYSDLNRIGHIL